MEKLKFLNSKDIKKINQSLKDQFGIELNKDKAYLISEKNRLYMVNKDIQKINDLRFDSAGLYIGTFENNLFRFSIEGTQIFGHFIKQNVVEINEDLFNQWISGKDIEIETEFKGPVIIKHKKDFCGCGISKNNIILNYVPKERRSNFN